MSTDSPHSSLPEPKIISGSVISHRYLIRSILGQGEFGYTYLAVDSYRFYEPCILKEFNPAFIETIKQNDEIKSKLYYLLTEEAELLYQLDHPQISNFFAYFHLKERFFIVQEYIKGKSYRQLLQQRQKQRQLFQEAEIIDWLINLLLLLEYIHNLGIIHRNISLQNIIQSEDGQLPVLIDFSIGKKSISLLQQEYQNLPNSISSFPTSMEVNKSFANKVAYAPYEQIKLGLAFPCSDLYSLGVCAVVLLTGKQPSSLVDENSLAWRWSDYTKVSEPLTDIINKLLAYNPKHRYQSARQVLRALQPLGQKNSPLPQQESHQAAIEPKIPISSRSSDSIKETSYVPSSELIALCQQKLAYYIGPIANLIVEEILNSRNYLTKQEFIEAIAKEIPDRQKRIDFQTTLQTETNLFE